MKNLFLFFVAHIYLLQVQAQHFALANEKFNIAYIGVDNPISIAVENYPCNDIVLKVDNGTITGNKCLYIFRGTEVGAAHVTVYVKKSKGLKKIGQYAFRIKKIPPPTFKIGPYGSSYFYSDRKARAVILRSQQYVRADLEGFDFDARCIIDSFSIKIFSADSGKINTLFNVTNKVNQEIESAFSELKSGDIIFFYKIFAKGPDGIQWELDPLILTIED